ncbi:DUF3040 domain-containing protein [Streptomyces flaveolus]|uniref:DUF3040 domain-containing protein n=1 Tax=Streptomyces flaveolus TaxID=67297 RepID=UPI0036FC9946
MPLSEHEQRMLEQMERALYAEDPKFASALEGSGLRTYTRRRVYQAVAGFLVGIALLMAGMVAKQVWLSVVGFLVMLGCAVLAVTGWRKAPKPGEQPAAGAVGAVPQAGRQARQRRSMMDRIEERWQRRRDEQQGGQ